MRVIHPLLWVKPATTISTQAFKEMMPFLAAALVRRKPAGVMSLLSPACQLLNSRPAVVTFSSSPPSHADVEAQPKRRTRRRQLVNSSNSNSNEPIPSLADFMHRARVRKQYRNFVRLAHFVDGKKSNGNDSNTTSSSNNATGECRAALEEVRLSYQLGIKKGTDSLSKSMAYNEGERRLRELEAIVGYSPSSSWNGNGNSLENDGVDKDRASGESYDADSWINIKDDEDKRGRVGVVWPWERDDASK